LRVLPGPQDDWFDDASFARLTSGRFTVAPQSDRMGYRLAGPAIPFACARGTERERATMISDATFPGAVQVTPSGDAMLLLADRQTTGGYPQIAVVISADLPRAGQLAPGDWVSFELCTYTEARSALVSREADLRVPR
jgi:antagonist of KipI